MGVKRCLATASGTTALITSLKALGVDAGMKYWSLHSPSLPAIMSFS